MSFIPCVAQSVEPDTSARHNDTTTSTGAIPGALSRSEGVGGEDSLGFTLSP